MGTRKYVVRDGFIVVLKIVKADGSFTERTFDSAEVVELDDDDAALHRHKLEFANQKDRDAALDAEKKAQVASAAAGNPAELVGMLVAALQQAQQAAAPAAA